MEPEVIDVRSKILVARKPQLTNGGVRVPDMTCLFRFFLQNVVTVATAVKQSQHRFATGTEVFRTMPVSAFEIEVRLYSVRRYDEQPEAQVLLFCFLALPI